MVTTNIGTSRSLSYDMRRSLKVQIDQARRARVGVTNPIDLSSYPEKSRWSVDDCLHFIQLATDVLGHPPSRMEYEVLRGCHPGTRRGGDRRMPCSDVAVRRFGSWGAALESVVVA